MKNKAPLALIELVIMILIFALAAALCLQAFVWSKSQSENNSLRDEAAVAVQNAAEYIKSSKGDESAFAMVEAADTEGFYLDARVLDVNTLGLGSAVITACSEDDCEIFSLQVFWQKPYQGGEGHE